MLWVFQWGNVRNLLWNLEWETGIEPATFSLGNRPSIENKEHSGFSHLILAIENTGYSKFCLAESLTVFKRSSPGTTQPPPTKLRSSHDVISASGCQPGI